MDLQFLLFCLFLRLNGVFAFVKTCVNKTVMEGESVILNTDVTEIQRDEQIRWSFITDNLDSLIADIHWWEMTIKDSNERFRNRLQLNNQTGSLTIRNIRITDSGVYRLMIIDHHNKMSYRYYNISVEKPPERSEQSLPKNGSVLSPVLSGFIVAVIVVLLAV